MPTYVPEYPEEMMKSFVNDLIQLPAYTHEKGLNAKAISEGLKLTRSTCWLYLKRSMDLDLIRVVNDYGHEKFYAQKKIERTVKFRLNAKQEVPLVELAKGFAYTSQVKDWYGRVALFPRVIGYLYHYASEIAQGSKLIKRSDLKDIKVVLQEYTETLENRVRLAKAMLADDRLWDFDSFADTLMLDPDNHLSWEDAGLIFDKLEKAHKEYFLEGTT